LPCSKAGRPLTIKRRFAAIRPLGQSGPEQPILKVIMVHGVGTHVPGYSARLSANLAQALGLSVTDLAPEFRTGRFFSYAALAIVMSILACAGVRYPTLEWRRCRL
jgi:hypothetical protein